jgi:hypothetical protein
MSSEDADESFCWGSDAEEHRTRPDTIRLTGGEVAYRCPDCGAVRVSLLAYHSHLDLSPTCNQD